MQNKKRTGLISILIIILCLSVCIGATYAYFTDSVESKNNIIKAGKLDVTMEWANGTADPKSDATAWTDASTGAIFNYQLWEPGYTDVRHIRIKNVGNLAFQYKLVIVANGEISTTTVDGETISLADVIDVYYFDPAIQVEDREVLANKTRLNNLTNALAGMGQTATGNLKAGESVTITIALKMQEDADNKYQELSIGTDFSIQLHATQYTHESDAFDHLYDCLHTETEVIAGYPATYEETGLTDGVKCLSCQKVLVEQEEIPVLTDLTFIFLENGDDDYYSAQFNGPFVSENLVVPTTYAGLPVREIAGTADPQTNNVTKSITIPESVTRIEFRALACSYSLETITLTNSVKYISYTVFYGAPLQKIVFKGTVAEWNAIEKRDGWNESTGDYTIYCTDGQIAKNGTVTYN